VLYFLGFIVLILGGVMLIPIPAAVLFGEAYQIPYFLVPAAVALALGLLMRWRFPRVELSLGHAMVVVALAWIIASLFSVAPYMLGSTRLRGGAENPTPMGFVDSYFESMSGFTATGLTMIPTDNTSPFNIETTPMTVLFWRSLTEWVGGLGVIVLFLAALIGAGKAARKLYVAEARAGLIEPSIRETAKTLWKIYALLTTVGVLGFLLIGGMGVFESINHSMTAIATGGFTVRNTSFAGYGTPAILVGVVIMILGATSFAVHRRVIGGQWREFFKNVEVRLMLALIAIITLILAVSVGLTHSLFQSTSALTGTGFSTARVAEWGDLSKGALTILMVIGGGYGSTSSAIKLIRWVIILKAVHWWVKRSFLPERAVVPMKVAGRVYTHEEVMETSIYAFIYILVLVVGAIIIALLGYSMVNAMFESASAQGNVGLSVGITSATMPDPGKVVFIVQMLVGRLEIIPVIALLSYFVTRIPRPRA